jgi:allantoicase
LKFPAFAAGFSASAMAVCQFNAKLARAFVNPRDPWHDFVVQMVWGCDFGSKDFMQALSGLGTFLIEAGSNRFMLHQGANDGFRAIYLSCYQGPDFGKTITVLVNADQEGVYAIAEIVQLLLKSMEFSGIDFDQFQKSFDDENIPTEQKVNQGYKNLLFKAFLPDLPESIVRDNGVLMDLNQFNVLQKAKLIKVSNQKFARAENLISPCKPTFDPRLFGNQGKIMDSWESARHNQSPCDSAEFELIKKSQVNFIFLSTEFHLGNQAPMVSVEGFADSWQTILPQFKMEGHSTTKIKLNPRGESYTKIRVNIYPDGGLSRIQLFEKLPDEIAAQFQPPERAVCEKIQALIPKTKKPMTLALDPKYLKYKSQDLACSLNGGKIIAASNEHYAPASQVISPFEPLNMFDGLENSRSRQMGNSEFVIIELCKKTVIQEIVLDFSYFVNNNPRFVSIEAGNAPQGIDASKVKDGDFEALSFDQLVPKTFVKPFAGNKKIFKIKNQKKFRYLKVLIFPDGGINRIRVF